MNKILKITLGFLLLASPTFAQINDFSGITTYRNIAQTFFIKSDNNTYDINEISGSPFLNKNFNKGYVLNTNSNNKVQTYLRYDIYNDLFEIKLDSNSESLKTLERSVNYEYLLNGEKFVLIESSNVINENHYTTGNGYVVELIPSIDRVGLYKRYSSKLIPGKKATSSYGKDTKPSIRNSVKYFLKLQEKFVQVEDHKRRILDAFPDNQKKLKKYIKGKGFKFRGSDRKIQNQMVKVVRYYNSLN